MADDPLTRAIDETYGRKKAERPGVSYEGDTESDPVDVAPKESPKLTALRKKVEEKYGTVDDLTKQFMGSMSQGGTTNMSFATPDRPVAPSADAAPIASTEVPQTGRLGALAGVGMPDAAQAPPQGAGQPLSVDEAVQGALAPPDAQPLGGPPPAPQVGPAQGQLPPGTTGWSGGKSGAPGGSVTNTTVTKKGIAEPEREAALKEYDQLATNLSKAKVLAAESRGQIADRVREQYEDEKARQAEEYNKYEQARKDAFAQADAKVAAEQKKYEDFEPESYFAHAGAGRGIATLLAMMSAGFLQGWTHGAVGGDMMKAMTDTISDDAKEQWEKRRVGLKSAEGEVAKTSREWNNRDDFMRARMAGGWQQVAKMADALMRSPETPEEARQKAIELKMTALSKAQEGWGGLRRDEADRTTETKVAQMRFQYGPSAVMAMGQPAKGEPALSHQEDIDLRNYKAARMATGMDKAMPYLTQAETALQDPLAGKVLGFVHAHGWQASPTAFVEALKMEGRTPAEIDKSVDLYRRISTVVNNVAHAQYGSAQTHPELSRLQGQLLTDYDPNHILSAFRDIKQVFLNDDNLNQVVLSPRALQVLNMRIERGAVPQAQTMVGGYTPPTTGGAGVASPGKGPAPDSLKKVETPEEKEARWKAAGFKPAQ